MSSMFSVSHFFFFFNDTATTEIYTLSLHDALPIFQVLSCRTTEWQRTPAKSTGSARMTDRKSTRLNSSHLVISYAAFCLKKNEALSPYRKPAFITPV